MNDSRAMTENIQDALGTSESKRVLKINICNKGMSKGHGDQLKELPVTKTEKNLSSKTYKIILDCNLKFQCIPMSPILI